MLLGVFCVSCGEYVVGMDQGICYVPSELESDDGALPLVLCLTVGECMDRGIAIKQGLSKV